MADDGRYGTVEESRSRAPHGSTAGYILPLLSTVRRGRNRSAIVGGKGESAPLHPAGSLPQALSGSAGRDDHACKDSSSDCGCVQRVPSTGSSSGTRTDFKAAALVGVLAALVTFLGLALAVVVTPNLTNLGRKTVAVEYDFIVVGGGPAGSMLARRLSDDLHNRVLLLEAGGGSQFELAGQDFLSNPLTPFDIPLMWPSVSHMKDVHWEVFDHTKKDGPNALVAKALGGCGIHNAMLYVRGLESDFVKWDVEGFDYESSVEIWKANENYTGPGELPDWHGRGGPISTTPPTYVDEVAPFFLDSCKDAGIPLTDDFNKPGGREGAGYYHFAVKKGIRDSAARALLGDVIMRRDVRTNLDILTGSQVNRVLLTGGDEGLTQSKLPAAVGVEYVRNGIVEQAKITAPASHGRAGTAVVVTAGALHTPKLLMLSGIGDEEELKSNNLGCVSHAPELGKNLQDHTSVGVMYMLGPDLLKIMPSAYLVAQELERYKMGVLKAFDLTLPPGVTRDGVDADIISNGEENSPSIFSSAGLSAGAFLKSPYTTGNMSAPDIQLTVFPRVTEPHILALADIRPSPRAPPTMLVTVSVLNPEGRSTVRLDPKDPYYGNPSVQKDEREGAPKPVSELDAQKLAWGVGQVRRITDASPLREELRGEIYPGPGVSGQPDDTAGEDKNLVQWVKDHIYSNSHWCGTARMGKASDPRSVVDERMAVKGVRGLFVGDASVMPFIPNGNVHSTVVLVAAKLAAYLLADAAVVREEKAKRRHKKSG